MRLGVAAFYEFLARPLFPASRAMLALLVLPLLLSFAYPLWTIRMEAPQYPEGLSMEIYAHTVEGGRDGADIKEINILNHYIGMKKIERADLTDLDWIPFAIGVLCVFTLRVAAIGNVRSLVDLAVMTGYFSAFSLARFVFKLYTYGHELDPDAPVKIPGFTPALFGTRQIANFTTHSFPGLGTAFIGVFAIGLGGVLAWHLVAGRRQALGAREASAEPPPPPSGDEPSVAAGPR